METFLDALSPSVREKTREALALENGEARLRQVASRYIDEEGLWPVEPATADYIARLFINQSNVAADAFAPHGLKGPTIAALSAGALSLGKGKTLISLGSKLVGKYWVEMLSYSVGVNPALALAVRGAANNATTAADWLGISRKMETGFDEQVWRDEFADEYSRSLERSILGRLAQSAWRGSRSAANHITSKRVGDVSVNEWIQDYVAKVAQSQAELSLRTARHIVENSLELPANVMAGRLEQMWALTPHHVDSVNRYRAGLSKQDQTASWVNRMTKSYADRLVNQRIDAITRTEAQTAFNLGRETQWLRSVSEGTLPADTVKMWITGQDEKVCEVCEPMDGKTAPLGEVFEDIGLYVPSAHPNCRCIVIPAQLGVANMDDPQLVFPVHDVVEKRTILIPEYEREDGTKVRRHTRVIGERDAADRWRDAPATKDHEKIAEFFNTYNFPEVPHSKILDVEKPSSYPKQPSADNPDLRKKYDEWKTKVEAWWDTEDGKKYTWDLRAAENRWYSSVARDAIESASESVDREVLKSALFGSRIWTTQSEGVGLVRQLSGMTDYPTHREVDLSSYRESKIRAASDFLNVVRSAPPIKKDLYRGVKIADEHQASLRDMKKVGGTLNLPVSSFTEDRRRGEGFMGQYMIEKGYTPVLFTLKNSNALRLPNETSNRLYAESEFVTSGEFTIDEVELPTADDRAYRITISPVGVSKANRRYSYIEDALCTPLPRPWRSSEISKRTITVREYTRSDGTVVEEHQRKIDPEKPSSDVRSGFTNPRVREFLDNFSRDGELTYHEATALGTMAAAAIALGSRGRIRRGMNPTIYDEMGKLPSGELVVPPKLMESLRKTYTYKSPNSGLRTEIKSVNVETAPHHTYMGQRLHEMLGGQADMPALIRGKQTLRGRVADRYLVKRDNIFVEAQVVNAQGRTVGRFETTIDPRKREVFQDGFFMDSNYQGSGFSGEFTAHIGMRYVETGIDSIGVFAGGPVGGYAWASRGFGWRYGPSKDVLKRLSEAQRRTDLYPEPVLQEIRDVRRKMLLGLGTGKFPTPQEISKIGNQVKRVEAGSSTSASARQTWAGKDIMLGSNWHASLNIREVRRLLRKEGVIKLLSPRHLSLLSVGSRA